MPLDIFSRFFDWLNGVHYASDYPTCDFVEPDTHIIYADTVEMDLNSANNSRLNSMQGTRETDGTNWVEATGRAGASFVNAEISSQEISGDKCACPHNSSTLKETLPYDPPPPYEE